MRQEPSVSNELMQQLEALSLPLRSEQDLAPLYAHIGQAPLVLLGEASHGTSEYYRWRTAITKELVTRQNFSFVAVEGDWPDCFLINQYIKGRLGPNQSARRVLMNFRRWPTWMWANEEMIDLVEWLKSYNDERSLHDKVGFYGLDVYSLWESLHVLSSHLKRHDQDSIGLLEEVFACFARFEESAQDYARATYFEDSSCEVHVSKLLDHLKARQQIFQNEPEAHLQAAQNARVIKNGEAYYRNMVRAGPLAWNIRDSHMIETLQELMNFHGEGAKGIVWEHNTHIGDARFTDMRRSGEVNVGQLAREHFGEENIILVGFSSYQGTVIAARRWEAPMQVLRCPAGRIGSWEDVLHNVGPRNKLLLFSSATATPELYEQRGHRAIGVVYHPEMDHRGNYVPTQLVRRYDALISLDQTEALHPLHLRPLHGGDAAETYPSAM